MNTEKQHREFNAFSSVGSYPLVYLDKNNNALCHVCARDAFEEWGEETTCDCYFEGPPICCDSCSKEIESAYGDPDNPEEVDPDAGDPDR